MSLFKRFCCTSAALVTGFGAHQLFFAHDKQRPLSMSAAFPTDQQRVGSAAWERATAFLLRQSEGNHSSSLLPSAACASASIRDKFNAFASVVDVDGNIYMSFSDVLLSFWRPADKSGTTSSGSHDAVRAINASSANLQKLFKLFDLDGDERLSFTEYCILHTILSSSPRHVATAFKMFDEESKSGLTKSQFEQMLRAMVADPTVEFGDLKASGIVRYLFNKRERLSCVELQDFVEGFRDELLRSEFSLADTHNIGRLSLAQMRRLVYQKGASRIESLQVTLPNERQKRKGKGGKKGKRDDIRKARVYDDLAVTGKNIQGGATAEDYLAVTRILGASSYWSTSVTLYIDGEGDDACDIDALTRALSLCPFGKGRQPTQRQIDLFFKMFDLDDSGSLTWQELECVAQGRSTFFAKHTADFSQPKRNKMQEWFHCMQQR